MIITLPNFGIKWTLCSIWVTGMIKVQWQELWVDLETWYIPRSATGERNDVNHSTYVRGCWNEPYSEGNKTAHTWPTVKPSKQQSGLVWILWIEWRLTIKWMLNPLPVLRLPHKDSVKLCQYCWCESMHRHCLTKHEWHCWWHVWWLERQEAVILWSIHMPVAQWWEKVLWQWCEKSDGSDEESWWDEGWTQ